ncbi:hypothetical protein SLEP1_g50550 [Rubroshorea leprosula]|uniref:Uncharacterized protein n=1 Tax=Rubroshorea leprosula TaxID=152421 RepID=A0AAV5M0E7_9ROSI|nr:hypothetical protein SLEP1_g50550 [Rubroshorea leprosula]
MHFDVEQPFGILVLCCALQRCHDGNGKHTRKEECNLVRTSHLSFIIKVTSIRIPLVM